MENMDKGFTVPNWVLINWQKIPQMPQNLSAQFVCPYPKISDFDEKKASLGVRNPWGHGSYFLATVSGDDRQQIVAGDIVCNMKQFSKKNETKKKQN